MNSQPLRVLIAADDRSLLRDLSRFLTMFGYDVQQAAGVGRAMAAMERERADIILVDESLTARVGLDFCRSINRHPHEPAAALIWLVESLEADEVADALAAGVEDFLARPIDRGELLARLRAAGRMLEYERRAREQSGIDPNTGLLSRSAFFDLAEREAAVSLRRSNGHRHPAPLTCVVFDLDFFSRVRRVHGPEAERRILAAAIDKLPEWCATPAEIACLGGDRFAALLPQFSEAEAADWSDQLRLRLRDTEFRYDRHAFTFTASFGVAQHDQVELIEDFVARAEQALETAKESGRDFVCCSDPEAEDWVEENSPENWFHDTLARDVMIACPVWLHEDDTMAQAAALLKQTGAPILPVVNKDQRLVGGISEKEVAEFQRLSSPRRDQRLVVDSMEVCIHRESERAPFTALMDRFAADPSVSVILVQNQKPVGIVTLGALAALSTPLDQNSFASQTYEASSQFLRVSEEFSLPSA
ncbi:response regulator [Lignipirellula cremea]|uniref:diguanylate cyclase n=1 Tax=Lignipirellula cremea TaxID=2528010 RepID=A0A518DN24_9BACT|nr:response regulator [Lignipirellula cremea]QDU93239.1 Response regulator PleD [Lignipirellula cremea]